jgi:hypothetical protein
VDSFIIQSSTVDLGALQVLWRNFIQKCLGAQFANSGPTDTGYGSMVDNIPRYALRCAAPWVPWANIGPHQGIKTTHNMTGKRTNLYNIISEVEFKVPMRT